MLPRRVAYGATCITHITARYYSTCTSLCTKDDMYICFFLFHFQLHIFCVVTHWRLCMWHCCSSFRCLQTNAAFTTLVVFVGVYLLYLQKAAVCVCNDSELCDTMLGHTDNGCFRILNNYRLDLNVLYSQMLYIGSCQNRHRSNPASYQHRHKF